MQAEQGVDGGPADVVHGRVNRGEAGDGQHGRVGVVVADHAHVIRHPEAGPQDGAHDREGVGVVGREHGGRRIRACQHVRDGVPSGPHPLLGDEVGIERDTRPAKCFAVPDGARPQAWIRRVPSDEGDPPVAETEQVLDRLLPAGGVARADTRDRAVERIRRVDRDERDPRVEAGVDDVGGDGRRDDDHADRTSRRDAVDEAAVERHLVSGRIRGTEAGTGRQHPRHEIDVRPLCRGDHAVEDTEGVDAVQGVEHDVDGSRSTGDRPRCRAVPELAHGRLDPGTRRLGHARSTVDHLRDGRDRDTGALGNRRQRRTRHRCSCHGVPFRVPQRAAVGRAQPSETVSN